MAQLNGGAFGRPVSAFAVGMALAATALSSPAVADQVAAVATAPNDAGARLKTLYEADWDFNQRDNGSEPDGKGGYKRATRLPSVDLPSQQRRIEQAQRVLAELDTIPLEQLSNEDRINAAVLRTNLEHTLIDGRASEWEMPFNSDSNFWTYLARAGGLRTVEDFDRHIARMRDIPRYFDEHKVNMRAGLARGFSVPRVTAEGRDSSISSFITDTAEANAFFDPFRTMPATIPAADQERIRADARGAIIEEVIPAYRQLLSFYNDEYIPRTRTTLAAYDMPNGPAYYAEQIRKYTTTDLTADQIHQIGLSEVARITAEMHEVMKQANFNGTLQEFITFLRTDPQFVAKTPDELLMTSAWVAKRVDAKLSENFGLLPRRPYTIIPVPEALAPFYTAGRGGLGSCQMNTYDLPSRPLYNIPALTLHECAPGHSMQAALSAEQQGIPAFRRSTYFSGYGEGWGLYTEWLGVEMGIYRTPYENFGRLSYEMWRAARLVIDTGVHAKGWTRQQAIDYLASHTALSQHEVATEVDRYISWPGQALAYKLGEITIRRLRAEAEAALGQKFDKRTFHDRILAMGAVPLTTLEEQMRAYIAEEQAK
ncbi:DUF885 domain-containing protein [Brevundimonas pishanensis]|uniref:DUF885 domain-containing protein n=1 Tax=Brevundimonas pishanensis TaxID=2896315 RepID=UPI001FA7CD63|nr:DUF885 family protein [Brevundimonas pishanensis]